MDKQDFTLTIEDVSKRLNKSTRTIHRYKDTGKLSYIVGATQGNPLFFSRSEVDALTKELYPALATVNAPPVDPRFWD
ncbi:MAG: helix-turn-helix domain-containing protein, partial [Candidatus Sericytochromatia bacterium]